MSPQQILLGLAGFFHNLFTVVWVGGLLMIVITVIPAARKAYGKGNQTQLLMNAILKQNHTWVYISILGLIVTGVIQARFEPAFTSLLRFDSPYTTLVSVKHLLTIAMVGIALFRSLVLGKKLETAGHKLMESSVRLIVINACLGVLVLALSSVLDVM